MPIFVPAFDERPKSSQRRSKARFEDCFKGRSPNGNASCIVARQTIRKHTKIQISLQRAHGFGISNVCSLLEFTS